MKNSPIEATTSSAGPATSKTSTGLSSSAMDFRSPFHTALPRPSPFGMGPVIASPPAAWAPSLSAIPFFVVLTGISRLRPPVGTGGRFGLLSGPNRNPTGPTTAVSATGNHE